MYVSCEIKGCCSCSHVSSDGHLSSSTVLISPQYLWPLLLWFSRFVVLFFELSWWGRAMAIPPHAVKCYVWELNADTPNPLFALGLPLPLIWPFIPSLCFYYFCWYTVSSTAAVVLLILLLLWLYCCYFCYYTVSSTVAINASDILF